MWSCKKYIKFTSASFNWYLNSRKNGCCLEIDAKEINLGNWNADRLEFSLQSQEPVFFLNPQSHDCWWRFSEAARKWWSVFQLWEFNVKILFKRLSDGFTDGGFSNICKGIRSISVVSRPWDSPDWSGKVNKELCVSGHKLSLLRQTITALKFLCIEKFLQQ